MIDLKKFSEKYWGRLRRYAYRLTGSILDAEDAAQETMLRAIEMGPALENISNHLEWLHIAATEAVVGILKGRQPIPLEEFDLPDLIQTTGAGADSGSRPIEGEADWPGADLSFLFPLQYMEPEQRAVLALRDGFEDGDRMAATALGVSIQEIFAVAEEAEKVHASVRKRWGAAVSFAPLGDDEKSAKVFERFLEIFQMKDAVLMQQMLWKNAEMILAPERTTGQDFVATELTALGKGMGERFQFAPVWLNGCRGVLISTWQPNRAEWLRTALALILCNEREVRAVKWSLEGHILRSILAEETGDDPSA
jgi:RNA polymerase sigma-70 factor (ECF subfamily)